MLSDLAPARRRLILGLAAAVLVAAVAVTLTALVRGRDDDVAAVPADRPGPVLLVPGYGGSTTTLRSLAARLRAAGRDARVVDLPGGGTGDLNVQVAALDAAARAALADTGAPSVDVVGYSAGGVVARLWVRAGGGRDVTRRVITLGSPHHGTRLAALAGSLAPDQCPLACQQLNPDSDLLRRLNAGDETPAGVSWVSVWTTVDQVVVPPDSARLDGALNVPVQDICPDSRVEHGQLPADRTVQGIVLAEIGPAPPAELTSAECSTVSS